MLSQVAPSATAVNSASDSRSLLDRAVSAVAENRRAFARLPVAEKQALLRELVPRFLSVSEGWVKAACEAKRIPLGTPVEGEEWLAGPMPTIRNLRLLANSLREVMDHGRPSLGRKARTRADGRVEVQVLPSSGWDSVLHGGVTCWVLLEDGVTESSARERQASFYQQQAPEGAVSLVLGAGNVSSIPPMDVIYKMFVEGSVCVLKMNPVNAWVGPFLEQAFEPLISRHFLHIAYGGAEEGAYLCEHPAITEIHITGSDRTHDRIIWGPPGAEQERRKLAHEPLLKKPITSELGNVSPVVVVPAEYSPNELAFTARNIVTMVANNGSFNCNAAKLLVTAKGWPQRDRLLELIAKGLSEVPPRYAYYPGAHDRYEQLTRGRDVQTFGTAAEGELPWTLIPNVDSSRKDEPLFQIEPFCGIISHTEIPENDAAAFISQVSSFLNNKVWGTLNAMFVMDPRTEAKPDVRAAFDKALLELRYGTITVNLWPGVAYGSVSPPWGGHQSVTLENIQSGLGWVHNTFMLEGIDKSVLRGPLVMLPKPAWYFDNKTTHVIGRRLTKFEARPTVWGIPSVASAALFG